MVEVTRRALPVAGRIALIYLAARLVTTGFFLLAATQTTAASRHGAEAGIADFVLAWDAQWYWTIAVNGYPTELPLTDGGDVAQNAWAFMPIFAYLAQLVGVAFGSWGAGAAVVSLIAGYVACLALFRLLEDQIGDSRAMWAVLFFAIGPVAALFQVGYAESLFMMFLLLALNLVRQHRYGWVYLLVVLMGFTRPGVLAFALFIALHGLFRLRYEVPRKDVFNILGIGALATVVGFSWQVIAAVVTGSPNAYFDTELAWRNAWIGESDSGFVPFEGWIQGAQFWSRFAGLPEWGGVLVLVVLVAGFGYLLLRVPAVRALGTDIRLWCASYALYLLAVFFPQSSTLRLLFPLSPLWGAVAVPRSLVYRISVVIVCLGVQWLWIHNVFAMADTFWRVP